MFLSEGRFPVTITEALIGEPKFNKNAAFDVYLKVDDGNGQVDYWNGEVSNDFGRGTLSDKKQVEITLMTLRKIGWKHECEFAKIGELVGVKTIATTKASKPNEDGKVFYNVRYLGDGGSVPTKMDDSEIAKRLAALNGGASFAAPADDTLSHMNGPADNPFG